MEFLEQAFIILGVLSALGIFLLGLGFAGTVFYIYIFSKYAEKFELGEDSSAREKLVEEEEKVEVLDPWTGESSFSDK